MVRVREEHPDGDDQDLYMYVRLRARCPGGCQVKEVVILFRVRYRMPACHRQSQTGRIKTKCDRLRRDVVLDQFIVRAVRIIHSSLLNYEVRSRLARTSENGPARRRQLDAVLVTVCARPAFM